MGVGVWQSHPRKFPCVDQTAFEGRSRWAAKNTPHTPHQEKKVTFVHLHPHTSTKDQNSPKMESFPIDTLPQAGYIHMACFISVKNAADLKERLQIQDKSLKFAMVQSSLVWSLFYGEALSWKLCCTVAR